MSWDPPLSQSLAQLFWQSWLCLSETATVPFELQAGARGSGVTDIRMTHLPCLFPLFPFNNPRTSFLFHSAFRVWNVSPACLREGWISADCSFPKGCTLTAAGLTASSVPNGQPGPELLDADRCQGTDQTMSLTGTLRGSLEIPPRLLQPQPNGCQPVTDCPLSEGTLQTRQPALR